MSQANFPTVLRIGGRGLQHSCKLPALLAQHVTVHLQHLKSGYLYGAGKCRNHLLNAPHQWAHTQETQDFYRCPWESTHQLGMSISDPCFHCLPLWMLAVHALEENTMVLESSSQYSGAVCPQKGMGLVSFPTVSSKTGEEVNPGTDGWRSEQEVFPKTVLAEPPTQGAQEHQGSSARPVSMALQGCTEIGDLHHACIFL